MKALLFLLVLIGGAAGGYFARPHVDQMIGMGGTEAEVTAKETDEEGRVILTLATEDATMLAAFTERAAEVDRLVAEGARVTLEPGVNAPFLDEPVLVHVRYGEQGIEPVEGEEGEEQAADDESAEDNAADGEAAEESEDGEAADGEAADEDGEGSEGNNEDAEQSGADAEGDEGDEGEAEAEQVAEAQGEAAENADG